MRVAFLSNYYNHHQSAFCEAMASIEEVVFTFIATEPMSEERISGGWGDISEPSYVLKAYVDDAHKKVAIDCINEADLVIFGSAPEWMIRERQNNNKLVFRYSERIYKSRYQAYKLPVRMVRYYKKYTRYKNTYMLCASAFTAADFAKTNTFIGKCFRWGYFPEFRSYERIESIIKTKKRGSILWVGRLIEWKHPDDVVEACRLVAAKGLEFSLTIVGRGPMEEQLKRQVHASGLDGCVTFIPVLKPSEVRDLMEMSQVFVLSSDYNEGWGAVLNESMNSACAVVASHAAGSVPFLVDDNCNGIVYRSGDVDSLANGITSLLSSDRYRDDLALAAYETIASEWNANVAATRVVRLAASLIAGETPHYFATGPCSSAPILQNEWIAK